MNYLYIVRSDQLANALAAFQNISTENPSSSIELYKVDAKQKQVLFHAFIAALLPVEEELLNLYGRIGRTRQE